MKKTYDCRADAQFDSGAILVREVKNFPQNFKQIA